jgi:hypothetical protein
MMRRILFCGLSTLALGAATYAQSAGTPPAGNGGNRAAQSVEERFKLLDTNKDGKVSQAEYVAAANPGGANAGANAGGNRRQGQPAAGREDRFKKMDTNKDGSLSLDEYKAGRASMGPGQQSPGGRAEKT